MPGDKPVGDGSRFMWFEGDGATLTRYISQCRVCKHFRGGSIHRSCDAFPDSKSTAEIPDKIFLNDVDHRQPYEGDQGIRWEPEEPGTQHPLDRPDKGILEVIK